MNDKPKRKRPGDGAQRVFNAICLLAQELGTPPPQQMVADHLGVTQQFVSAMMYRLEADKLIHWITRYYYSVDQSRWEPPPDSEL